MAEPRWFQQVLLAEEVVEVRIRVGLIPSRDHAQWMVEVVDPTTDRLLDAQSVPHRSYQRYTVWRAEFISTVQAVLDGLVEPF